MKPLQSEERLRDMRRRLYQRGRVDETIEKHGLTDQPVGVIRNWNPVTSKEKKASATDSTAPLDAVEGQEEVPISQPEIVTPPKQKRRYRTIVLLFSFILFAVLAGVSIYLLMFGGSQFSNENIDITISGQPLIGGGETLPLQIAIANQNKVAIESVTLILRYPEGTQSIGDAPRTLYEERINLESIESGVVETSPVQVVVFGDEGAEKKIEASIEYRVNGSSGTFKKDGPSFDFTISSSPIFLRVDNVEKVSSGQEVDVSVTLVSNTSAQLEDILVTAQYPSGFIFKSAEPAPAYGQDVWKISSLAPEEKTTIVITGEVTGLTEESARINFKAGPVNPENQFLLGAILADAYTEYHIEDPFIEVNVTVNGQRNKQAVIPAGKDTEVKIDIKNTLPETVYDLVVEVVPEGNALDENSIGNGGSGFYDSNTGSVWWRVANNPSFEQVIPGDSRTLTFSVQPGEQRTTASFNLQVNVYARRVAESSAAETLLGSTQVAAKYSADIMLGSQVGRNVGGYADSGPIPPTPGEETTYTLTMVVEAGANDADGAVVTTSLPVYVTWLDVYDAPGTVVFNPVTNKLEWQIGEIKAGDRKECTYQVRIKPSTSQVGQAPQLMATQVLTATDRFTGASLQDSAPPVTTELSTEMGFPKDNGIVVR